MDGSDDFNLENCPLCLDMTLVARDDPYLGEMDLLFALLESMLG